MEPVKPKEDRKKVALNRETYEMLKNFCRFNGLKPRMVIATFTELLLQNEALSQQVLIVSKVIAQPLPKILGIRSIR